MRRLLSSFLVGAAAVGLSAGDAAWKDDWASLLQPAAQETAAVEAASPRATATVVELPAPTASDTASSAPATPIVDKAVTPAAPPPPPVYLSPDNILQGLREALVEHFVLEGELELMPDTPLQRVQVPDASWGVELMPPVPATLGDRMYLRYRLSNGFEYRPVETIALRAAWWREAYVSNRLLRAGQLESNDAYSIQTVNWLQYRGSLVPVESGIQHLRLKATWRANEPLRWSIVETRPMIEEGAIIEVVAVEGALRISMRGVAMENGNAGELIHVRNTRSREEIQGIVHDENTVLVVF